MDIFSQIIKLTLLFLIIIDPFGNIPLFVGVLRPFSINKQRAIILREMVIALAVMMIFFFFGNGFLESLGISDSSLQVTGGIILFLIAVNMVFSIPFNGDEITKREMQDPLVVPLAIPAIAGPAILAALTVYSSGLEYSSFVVLVSIMITWVISTAVLLASPLLKKYLSNVALSAVEQLFGFFVVLISLDMIIAGLQKAFF
jgi:multiple antibiotic resistance protein